MKDDKKTLKPKQKIKGKKPIARYLGKEDLGNISGGVASADTAGQKIIIKSDR